MDEKDKKGLKLRLFIVGITVIVIFSLLTSRLWTLQIVKGADYATKAKGNIWRWVSIPASRGDVVDAKGKVLATSVPQFAITLDWLDLQNTKYDAKEVVKTLAKYVQPYWGNGQVKEDIIIEDILANIQMKQFRRYEPVVVMENIPAKLQAVLAEHQQELPGISVEARPFRIYPMGSVAGQILGYVREVSESELTDFQAKAEKAGLDKTVYQAGDFVGKMGVENSYDMYLRGQDGTQVMEVDNRARPVDRLNRQDPTVGNSIKLTIDTDLQKVVSDELVKVIQELKDSGKQKAGYGAAVVIEVKTGRILAMVSVPDMNPNELYGKLSPETFDRNFGKKEDGSPRLGWSRAFQETYAPGSTFKMITGMAALQDNKVSPEEKVLDSKSSLWYANSGIDAWSESSKG
ncbi:MAG TPA: penicillin-binding transpeptidase domain-containing protein, partial [Verrucomicrobiae bacterium]|nr:penicillin-binding transpeptidase domain-containing protein [Verrucomicrobiae bacterium]